MSVRTLSPQLGSLFMLTCSSDPTNLSFEQNNVSAIVRFVIYSRSPSPEFGFQTDKTALYLVGAIAPPILQHLVDQATLSFSQANIT